MMNGGHTHGEECLRLTTVIADDERLARDGLIALLSAHPQIDVVGQADSVASTVAQLQSLDPDLLFLDIAMPDGIGFDVFERIDVVARVVFVTAYDSYTLRAFELNALDYLMKPVSPERLTKTVDRLCGLTGGSAEPKRDKTRPSLELSDIVSLPEGRIIKFARVQQIVYIEAANDYVEVILESGRTALVERRLRTWQEILPDCFVQIHRSRLVNLEYVDEIEQTGRNWTVRLRGWDKGLVMSRRYAKPFRERLDAML